MANTTSKTPKARKASGRGEYTSPAVGKAIDVIEFLARQEQSVSVTAIAEGLGRTVGEIYRIVLALEQRRIVSRDEATDRLRLSLRLFDLANQFPPVERLIQVARPKMDTLTRRAMQSCHLAVAEDREVTVVATRESPLSMRYSVRTGSSYDMFETSSGAVIAAYMEEAHRERWLKWAKPPIRDSLRSRFEEIRIRGYEMRESQTVSGLSNISVPIHSQQGRILAALTVPYLAQTKSTLDPEGVLALQLEAAARMKDELG